MLDKIRGKKDNEDKNIPDLRGNNKKKSSSDIGGRLKGIVSRVSGKKGTEKKDEKKILPQRKISRPMPKHVVKPEERPRLKPPLKKLDHKKLEKKVIRGFGKRIPDDDQRTLVGAAVFAIILILFVGASYYFLVYAPWQEALAGAKQTKINEVNTYFTGPLAVDPRAIDLRLQIDAAETSEQVLLIDVLGPATRAWREYQTQQIEAQRDPFGRVMVVYAASDQKNIILRVADAQRLVNESDASVLSRMIIKTPDTVAIPLIISRLQAAGGLINVGNSVDVYLMNATPNQTVLGTPDISGATVLAILRAKDAGVVAAEESRAQEIAINELIQTRTRREAVTFDVQQLLRAAASRKWDENQVRHALDAYGWRLSDFERAANLGQLDAQYLVLLEVPRENAIFLIQNMNNVMFTIPTREAPDWMIEELRALYG